jgi:hypothetical protein
MHERCSNPRSNVYKHYGARGIRVHVDWHGPAGFWRFVGHVGTRPPATSLDRIDVDDDYRPGNVRWATPTEQTRNSRQCKRTPERLARLRELRAGGWTDVAIARQIGVSNVLVAHWARDLGLGPSAHSRRYRAPTPRADAGDAGPVQGGREPRQRRPAGEVAPAAWGRVQRGGTACSPRCRTEPEREALLV